MIGGASPPAALAVGPSPTGEAAAGAAATSAAATAAANVALRVSFTSCSLGGIRVNAADAMEGPPFRGERVAPRAPTRTRQPPDPAYAARRADPPPPRGPRIPRTGRRRVRRVALPRRHARPPRSRSGGPLQPDRDAGRRPVP